MLFKSVLFLKVNVLLKYIIKYIYKVHYIYYKIESILLNLLKYKVPHAYVNVLKS